MSRRWKEIKEVLERLPTYNDRAGQMKNGVENPGDDSQNEKMVINWPAVKQIQKAPKIPRFVDTD